VRERPAFNAFDNRQQKQTNGGDGRCAVGVGACEALAGGRAAVGWR
jgi:hypothetical protein